ncbi:hypothetical protein NE857_07715 [Nocardiopsis exhalans]|uniref:DUF3558 domain-containing protein n=1 Tax=Nocardiopsis exhalans TaxID=163604 RepID=A0ABY5DBT3_9ACTN|nr:hypothetical protein [Nocardiopsis exhalans]USY21487.1 hypothetical protein NE857_07715 [Nocardiopsis exhalans]
MVLLVVAVGGVLVFANSAGGGGEGGGSISATDEDEADAEEETGSGTEYVSLPNLCDEAVDSSILAPFFEDGIPTLIGGFNEGTGSMDSSYGTLDCSVESSHVLVEINAELVDLEDPQTQRELEGIFDGTEFNEEFMDGQSLPGEIHEEDFGLDMTASYLWDQTKVGDQSVVLVMATDAGEDFSDIPDASNSFAVGFFLTDNIAGSIVVNDSEGGRDVRELFNTVDSASGDLAKQLERVAVKK